LKKTKNLLPAQNLPFLVTDQLFRVAYIPPANVFAPVGRWASFSYAVKDTTTDVYSEQGRVVLSNAAGVIVGSSFVSGTDGYILFPFPLWQLLLSDLKSAISVELSLKIDLVVIMRIIQIVINSVSFGSFQS